MFRGSAVTALARAGSDLAVLSGLAMRSNAAVAVSRLRATSVVVMALSEVIASYLL
jgi:hypothetical protein